MLPYRLEKGILSEKWKKCSYVCFSFLLMPGSVQFRIWHFPSSNFIYNVTWKTRQWHQLALEPTGHEKRTTENDTVENSTLEGLRRAGLVRAISTVAGQRLPTIPVRHGCGLSLLPDLLLLSDSTPYPSNVRLAQPINVGFSCSAKPAELPFSNIHNKKGDGIRRSMLIESRGISFSTL